MSTAFEKSFENGDEENRYTYADYLAWETDKRCEIIDGTAYMMGAPSVAHQVISGELFGQFWTFLKGKPCRVFAAPFDVRLFPKEDDSDDTVVQPDLLVICDTSKLTDGRACRRAPDMVIEILSPSNKSPAMFLKYSKYLKAGVREYWVIDPETREIQTHIFERPDGQKPGRYVFTLHSDTVDLTIVPGLKIDFNAIWSEL
ncbi:MAG: Uma2 family endonuclease [Treponema sp.]|jgi:Uma2 family endonuclease|nr:Uma2 family endonuclease [Treponema sp.]